LSGPRNSRRVVRFTLRIPSDEYLAYYEGSARAVVVNSSDGRNIQFPAEHLRRFVTHDGIQGTFEMEFDEKNKFVNVRRIDD
jgi:hypothetical protein